MRRRGKSLQLVVLAPVLALNIAAGGVLYLLVLRTVGDYADESIRSNLDSLARTAFAIADAEVDRQNREGLADDPAAKLLFQLSARIRFEDFARDHDIGLIVEADDGVDFATGLKAVDPEIVRRLVPAVGDERLLLPNGGEYYTRPVSFVPWSWRLILVKDASAFEALVGEVRAIYVGSVALLLLVTLVLVLWLRQVLVRPISGIARKFIEGQEPDYRGVAELEELSDSIGEMMSSLRAKTLHLETALNSMSDAITVFDPEMRLVAWNPQFIELYHYPDGFVRKGLSFEEIMRFNVERGDYGDVDVEATLDRLVTRGRNMDPPRFEVDRADGTSIEIRRARMPDGGYVTIYTDITERRKAAEAEIAQQKAEAANEAKSDFLRNMSHDLRKPVVAIIEYVGLVLAKAGKNLPGKQRRNLENIRVSSGHLRQMIDEILEMSRIEAGQIEVNPEPVKLEPLVESSLNMIEPLAKGKGLAVSVEVEDGLTAFTDPGLLSRILMNLAGNAAVYTVEGSISVTVRRQENDLAVAVADTGIGIPAEQLDVIFEKFQQVEPTSGVVKPGMGLGLGLSISRKFAHLLGGEIMVESELGKGSTFTVAIPIVFKEAGI
jgi:signal transduction histidine kinase